jgi:hypothetical protein
VADFDLTCGLVQDGYGINGNMSVPPPEIG